MRETRSNFRTLSGVGQLKEHADFISSILSSIGQCFLEPALLKEELIQLKESVAYTLKVRLTIKWISWCALIRVKVTLHACNPPDNSRAFGNFP